jgi:hypothetical protein
MFSKYSGACVFTFNTAGLHSHSQLTIQSMIRRAVWRARNANTVVRHCRISPWVACGEPPVSIRLRKERNTKDSFSEEALFAWGSVVSTTCFDSRVGLSC